MDALYPSDDLLASKEVKDVGTMHGIETFEFQIMWELPSTVG